MKYDVVIVGAGPGGIFSAYELSILRPDLKTIVLEAGRPLEQRHCPINGTTVTNYEELNAAKDKYRAGDTITVTVTRSHQDVELTLILQERIPSDNN